MDLLIILLAVIVNCAVLYGIIHFSMRIKRQLWNQKQQLNLLIELAKKFDATGNLDIEKIKLKNNSVQDQYL